MATTDIRSADEIIAEMTRRVERFDPLQVILFGSRARGDARPDSDVDLLVVFPHVDDNRRMRVDIAWCPERPAGFEGHHRHDA